MNPDISAAENKFWEITDDINVYDGFDEYQKSIAEIPRSVVLLWAAHFTSSEICNGGFDQFFYNSTGIVAPEAVEGFRALGFNQVAALVEEAMAKLAPYERDRKLRWVQLAQAEGWDELDTRFYGLIDSENGRFDTALQTAVSSLPELQ